MDTFSGSLGLTGAADGLLLLEKMTGQSSATLHVTGRDVEEAEYALKLSKDIMSWQYMGQACEVRSTNKQQRVVDTLKEAAVQMPPKPLSPTDIAKITDLKVTYIKNTLPKLIDAGIAEKTDYGLYVYAGDCADSDDSSDHDDLEDTNDSKDLEDTDDSSDHNDLEDTDDPEDSLGVTEVTTVIKRSKRKRSLKKL
jgi:hypothetical protein